MNKSDIEILEKELCYQGFFRMERYTLRHRLFNGDWSKEIIRELIERGHAAAVFLYYRQARHVRCQRGRRRF